MKNILATISGIATFFFVNFLLYWAFILLSQTNIMQTVFSINTILTLVILFGVIFFICKTSIWTGFLVTNLFSVTKAYPLIIYHAFYIIVFAFSAYQIFVTPNPWLFKLPMIITYLGYIWTGILGIITSKAFIND